MPRRYFVIETSEVLGTCRSCDVKKKTPLLPAFLQITSMCQILRVGPSVSHYSIKSFFTQSLHFLSGKAI